MVSSFRIDPSAYLKKAARLLRSQRAYRPVPYLVSNAYRPLPSRRAPPRWMRALLLGQFLKSAKASHQREMELQDCSGPLQTLACEALVEPSSRLPGKERNNSSNVRSEEHTSELQSHLNLVCRLLLEK